MTVSQLGFPHKYINPRLSPPQAQLLQQRLLPQLQAQRLQQRLLPPPQAQRLQQPQPGQQA